MLNIAVIDGQGGGLGKVIIERLKQDLGQAINIIALGTNALATSSMLKAGADLAATGENSILFNVNKVDIIVGSVAIIAANSMLGEVTPMMSSAIASSDSIKVLIPLNRCNIEIIGTADKTIPNLVDLLVKKVKLLYNKKNE